MPDLVWIRYTTNEWQKLIRHPQLRVLWFLILIIPPGLAVFAAQARSLNPLEDPINDLRSKISLFFFGMQLLILPFSMLTFFIGLQLEHRYQTFLWPILKTIDEVVWIWGKWGALFGIYVLVFTLSMAGSILWLQLSHTFKDIDNRVVQHWFWELAFHFIFLPIPAFLTMFLIGLLLHRYTVALLVSIGLTYAVQQRGDVFAPFSSLRHGLNLNMLLLIGTPLWKYDDLGKYYLIAAGYSIALVILIRYLVGRIGIFRLFNL